MISLDLGMIHRFVEEPLPVEGDIRGLRAMNLIILRRLCTNIKCEEGGVPDRCTTCTKQEPLCGLFGSPGCNYQIHPLRSSVA